MSVDRENKLDKTNSNRSSSPTPSPSSSSSSSSEAVATETNNSTQTNELNQLNDKPNRNSANKLKRNSSSFSYIAPTSSPVTVLIIVISSVILLFSILFGYALYELNSLRRIEPVRYNEIIKDAQAYKWFFEKNFFENETIDLFRSLALNGETLSTIVEDSSVESAGEAVPVGHVDCKHPFMTLNLNRTMCHFSNRLDVGIHFVKTGGFNGYIEYYDRMVARILPFRKRLIQQAKLSNTYNSYINLKKLKEFNTESFISKAKSICADSYMIKQDENAFKKNSIINEMFQLDILLILPGQELPMHLNVPYFWGADRNKFPQWLLVVMKNSKLFENLFIPQVQGISWLNTEYSPLDLVNDNAHDDTNSIVDLNGEGGDFYLYPYQPQTKNKKDSTEENHDEEEQINEENVNKYVILKAKSNSAIILDGAQVIHGVDRYRPNDLPPLFASNHHYTIRFDQNANRWYLNDYQNNLLRTYQKNDVKLMVVWNMHCFANESQRGKFHSTKTKQLSLNDIIETFKSDLRSKNRLPSEKIEPIDLWTIALKEYLKYPENNQNQNSTLFGINYCLLPNIMPTWITNNFLNPFLNKIC